MMSGYGLQASGYGSWADRALRLQAISLFDTEDSGGAVGLGDRFVGRAETLRCPLMAALVADRSPESVAGSPHLR